MPPTFVEISPCPKKKVGYIRVFYSFASITGLFFSNPPNFFCFVAPNSQPLTGFFFDFANNTLKFDFFAQKSLDFQREI